MAPASRFDEWRRSAPGFVRRQAKTARQARHGWLHHRRLGFVFGCQRSGTKMVMRVLDRSPDTRIFHENHTSAFHDFQLRSDAVVRGLVALNPAPVQVFKPICDSHDAASILDRFPQARGVWIYRDPDDTAASAVRKWGDHQAEVVSDLLAGRGERWGWRVRGVHDALLDQLRQAAPADLTPHEGALLFWVMRNAPVFDQGLDARSSVRLVRYADLVTEPDRFYEVFSHLGARFSPGFVDDVRASSVGKAGQVEARPAVRALADALLARLDAARDAPVAPPMPESALILIDTLGTGGAERYAVTVANWLSGQGSQVVMASAGGDQLPLLAPEVRHVLGPFDGVREDLPRAARLLRQLVQDTRPAAIVANSLALTLAARLATAGLCLPIINVAHGWPEERYSRVGKLMRAADRVVAVSPEVKRKLVEGGLDAGRCAVVFNGVDCRPLARRTDAARAQARAEMGGSDGDILVAIVGRLEAQKAHQHVVTVAKACPDLRFAVVGYGSREDELRGLIDAAGVGDRVRLLGRRSDVPDLLGSADLYLNCSDWEGMPLTTIEAMASGLPIVATRTEGSAELLTDETGVVVEVADAQAMAEALQRLADDEDLRLRMGAAARARALQHFSHERMSRQLFEVVSAARDPWRGGAPDPLHRGVVPAAR